MYDASHDKFISPTNLDIPLWRYMDLPKLVSMLASQALWFSRSDLLGDPHEGARGSYNQKMRQQHYGEYYAMMTEPIVRIGMEMRRFMYISCWHMSEIESVAMWRAYTTTGHGVAVRSTFRKLVEGVRDERTFFAGEVRYVDPSSEWIDEENVLSPFLYKRKSFEYEREVRLAYPDFDAMEHSTSGNAPAVGLAFEADIKGIVEAVYVAPGHPTWFRDAVQAVVDKFCPEVEVRQSSLDGSPLF